MLLVGLATWRVSFMLHAETGPWFAFTRLRDRFGVVHDSDGEPEYYPTSSVFACIGCLSIWVALALYFLPLVISGVLAASSVAILFEGARGRLVHG